MTRVDLDLHFTRSTIAVPRNSRRMSNRTKQTAIAAPPENSGPNPFKLATQGHSLHRPPCDEGSDLDINSEDSDNSEDKNIDDEMFVLWSQFCLDITAICPNPKSATVASYCKLNAEQRKMVNTATYQNTVLSDYFEDVQWKSAGKDVWRANFDLLFPKKNAEKLGSHQNYNTVAYYSMWRKLMTEMDAETYRAARKKLWTVFRSVYWLPVAYRNRIWDTRPGSSFSRLPGTLENKPAPKIYLNGTSVPEWVSHSAIRVISQDDQDTHSCPESTSAA